MTTPVDAMGRRHRAGAGSPLRLLCVAALLLAGACSDQQAATDAAAAPEAAVDGSATGVESGGQPPLPDQGSPSASGGTGGATGSFETTEDFDGTQRLLAVYVPKSYDEAQPVPLLLHFHGWRPLPADVLDELRYLWGPTAEAEGFIAVAPQGLPCPELNPSDPYGCFRESRDGAFVDQLIAAMGQRYNIRTDRIFITGHSGGAFFVQSHGLLHSERFVAVATFSGGCIAASDTYGNSCSVYDGYAKQAPRKIPFFVVHHAQDQVVPVKYSADLLQVLESNGCPTSALDTYNPGNTGHSVDPAIVPQVYTWLSSHTLP